MRFERTITQVHRSPELQTFECRPCGLVVTAERGSFMSSTKATFIRNYTNAERHGDVCRVAAAAA